ncbi:Putative uncharacterized protein [Moritella viscosa]|nr:Putative uncharacterized protein [Moritella viscosa]
MVNITPTIVKNIKSGDQCVCYLLSIPYDQIAHTPQNHIA